MGWILEQYTMQYRNLFQEIVMGLCCSHVKTESEFFVDYDNIFRLSND